MESISLHLLVLHSSLATAIPMLDNGMGEKVSSSASHRHRHHNHNHCQGLWTGVSGEQLCGLVQRQPGHPPRGHHHLLVHCHKSFPWVYVAFPAALREWQAVDHREDRFGAEAQHASQDHFLRKKFLILDLGN